ncbi:MAG: cytosolic protein, partial [candidate division KSB1 bacterium]|nr:cytosolic protein [candidate division KSB1 bacterium]
FNRGFEFLDKELRQILKRSETGKRIVDKLVKIFLKNGSEKWLLLHIEIQGYEEKAFARRIFVYNYRIFDKFNRDVVSLVLLTDDNPHFRPHRFEIQRWGFRLIFEFPSIKLLEYRNQWKVLASHHNPFAIAVRAFLKTLETRGRHQERYSWKKAFLIELYTRGLSREIVLALYKFIDWIMTLPTLLEDQLFNEITEFEEKKNMPVLTTAEKKGIQQGIQRGTIAGLKMALQDILELKFGEAGKNLYQKIEPVEDLEVLQHLRHALKKAKNVAAAEKIIQDALGG